MSEIRHDVGLDEHGANGGQAHRVLSLKRDIADVSQGHAQSFGGAGEESSSAGGALVVHDEVFDVAVDADFNSFGVLPAHIDHRAGAGKEIARTPRMAADFGDLRVTERDFVPAITRAHHISDIFTFDLGDS